MGASNKAGIGYYRRANPGKGTWLHQICPHLIKLSSFEQYFRCCQHYWWQFWQTNEWTDLKIGDCKKFQGSSIVIMKSKHWLCCQWYEAQLRLRPDYVDGIHQYPQVSSWLQYPVSVPSRTLFLIEKFPLFHRLAFLFVHISPPFLTSIQLTPY